MIVDVHKCFLRGSGGYPPGNSGALSWQIPGPPPLLGRSRGAPAATLLFWGVSKLFCLGTSLGPLAPLAPPLGPPWDPPGTFLTPF